ncbi:YifB family Mg chelatase-like AAA ATPase [uncultured Schumannella sp.]|uniref:YifB family Mg chelatase-like AAA ATPase n=1 Tax=uncultured Schumannella sp. TaxID=1195956 RepID=UPI0025F6D40A|nr:YifB family Mg chelatase-like AAA ATPase [uncultured Schumannella sp.]
MPVGRAHAIALLGIDGAVVEIEADISQQLPAFVLIGLPDAALGEARDRVRAAAQNSGVPLPSRKLTINLSPAALPKHGSGFDLAIAMAAFAAEGAVSAESVARVVHLGELGLDGRLRPLPGVLPAVLAARRAGFGTVLVPAGNAAEAALVPEIRVVSITSLRDAAIWHGAELEPVEVEPLALAPVARDGTAEHAGDLSEILGNRDAVEALQVAAAGGHHMFLLGPPGAGKTMLAARLPGILPDLEPTAALEVSCIRSLAGLPVAGELPRRPPLEAPHHTASAAAIVGGGSTLIRPGAAARAAHGVLFLDEAPEFAPGALDALRQPLESGVIRIARANATAQFPARFQLLLAANPCPCGNAGARDLVCTCTAMARRRYLGRLSGPLLDRVDIQLRVPRMTAAQLRLHGSEATDSARARERVAEARERARRRLRDTPWRLNAHVPGSWLRTEAGRPSTGATGVLDRALERGAITMRGFDRIVRVAWTLADLDGVERPGSDQVGRALLLRKAAA